MSKKYLPQEGFTGPALLRMMLKEAYDYRQDRRVKK